jgi:DNA-directed RNA polymerase specialized sigma24 family protein
MCNRLRAIATHTGPDGYLPCGSEERTEETLAAFFALLRAVAEPETLTERSIAAHIVRRLHAPTRGPDAAVPFDPHAPVFDQALTEPDQHTQAAQLLEQARDGRVISALEYQTLTVLYLQAHTFNPRAAAHTLHASPSAVERRAQRAIKKLARMSARPSHSRVA